MATHMSRISGSEQLLAHPGRAGAVRKKQSGVADDPKGVYLAAVRLVFRTSAALTSA